MPNDKQQNGHYESQSSSGGTPPATDLGSPPPTKRQKADSADCTPKGQIARPLEATDLYQHFQPRDLLYGLSGTRDQDASQQKSAATCSTSLTRRDYSKKLLAKYESSRAYVTIDKINNEYIYPTERFIKGATYTPPRHEEVATWPWQAQSFYQFLTKYLESKFNPLNPKYISKSYDWHISTSCKAAFLWAADLDTCSPKDRFTIRVLLGGLDWQRVVQKKSGECAVTGKELRFLHKIWGTIKGMNIVKFYDARGCQILKDFEEIWTENTKAQAPTSGSYAPSSAPSCFSPPQTGVYDTYTVWQPSTNQEATDCLPDSVPFERRLELIETSTNRNPVPTPPDSGDSGEKRVSWISSTSSFFPTTPQLPNKVDHNLGKDLSWQAPTTRPESPHCPSN